MGGGYRREGWLIWEREGKSKGKVKRERGETVAGAKELAAVGSVVGDQSEREGQEKLKGKMGMGAAAATKMWAAAAA